MRRSRIRLLLLLRLRHPRALVPPPFLSYAASAGCREELRRCPGAKGAPSSCCCPCAAGAGGRAGEESMLRLLLLPPLLSLPMLLLLLLLRGPPASAPEGRRYWKGCWCCCCFVASRRRSGSRLRLWKGVVGRNVGGGSSLSSSHSCSRERFLPAFAASAPSSPASASAAASISSSSEVPLLRSCLGTLRPSARVGEEGGRQQQQQLRLSLALLGAP